MMAFMPFRIFRHVLAALALLVAFATCAQAQSRIAIVDATGISILDTGDGTERARFPFALPSGETFAGFEASADGGRLYITRPCRTPRRSTSSTRPQVRPPLAYRSRTATAKPR